MSSSERSQTMTNESAGWPGRAPRTASPVARRTQLLEQAISSGPTLLPGRLRQDLEDALGIGLGNVRLFTSSSAGTAAKSFGARAYTIGQDIFFGAGHFDPESKKGQHLIAHEVAHAAQQQTAAVVPTEQLAISRSTDAHEQVAHAFASSFVAHGSAIASQIPVGSVANHTISRDEEEGDGGDYGGGDYSGGSDADSTSAGESSYQQEEQDTATNERESQESPTRQDSEVRNATEDREASAESASETTDATTEPDTQQAERTEDDSDRIGAERAEEDGSRADAATVDHEAAQADAAESGAQQGDGLQESSPHDLHGESSVPTATGESQTQTFDDGSTLTTKPTGETSATPATDGADQYGYGNPNEQARPEPTTQRFDDGSSLSTDEYGNRTATEADRANSQSASERMGEIRERYTPGGMSDADRRELSSLGQLGSRNSGLSASVGAHMTYKDPTGLNARWGGELNTDKGFVRKSEVSAFDSKAGPLSVKGVVNGDSPGGWAGTRTELDLAQRGPAKMTLGHEHTTVGDSVYAKRSVSAGPFEAYGKVTYSPLSPSERVASEARQMLDFDAASRARSEFLEQLARRRGGG